MNSPAQSRTGPPTRRGLGLTQGWGWRRDLADTGTHQSLLSRPTRRTSAAGHPGRSGPERSAKGSTTEGRPRRAAAHVGRSLLARPPTQGAPPSLLSACPASRPWEAPLPPPSAAPSGLGFLPQSLKAPDAGGKPLSLPRVTTSALSTGAPQNPGSREQGDTGMRVPAQGPQQGVGMRTLALGPQGEVGEKHRSTSHASLRATAKSSGQ